MKVLFRVLALAGMFILGWPSGSQHKTEAPAGLQAAGVEPAPESRADLQRSSQEDVLKERLRGLGYFN